MACLDRYAEAHEFAGFWCTSAVLRGKHRGADGDPILTDTYQNFETARIENNAGMVLYNLTDLSHGYITAHDEHTITATLAGGTDNHWDIGDDYRLVTIDQNTIGLIEDVLAIAAGDINAALAAQNMCACNKANWAAAFLKKLNIIEAAAFYKCPCAEPNLSDDMRQNLLTWAENQMTLLRTGKLDVCSGATGAEFPALDWADQGVDEFSQGKIIYNDRLRLG